MPATPRRNLHDSDPHETLIHRRLALRPSICTIRGGFHSHHGWQTRAGTPEFPRYMLPATFAPTRGGDDRVPETAHGPKSVPHRLGTHV